MSNYTPSFDVSGIEIPEEVLRDVETIAEAVHEEWQRQRERSGWGYGDDRDGRQACMVPYEQLPEVEKDMDRSTVKQTIRMLYHLGYKIHK